MNENHPNLSRKMQRVASVEAILARKELVTADKIADQIGISARTVYRVIRDLKDRGVRVRGEAGVGYLVL